jgi:hypothetical protein
MTAEDLVTIAKYSDPFEPSMAWAMLESYGIHGRVVGGEINNILWLLGPTIAGVELQVAFPEADNASEILEEFAETRDALSPPNWICSQCAVEVEGNFDVCWSCGGFLEEPRHERAESIPSYAELQADEMETPISSLIAIEKGRRALRAAVIGIFFLQPILLYAFYLLAEVSEQELSKSALRQFRCAVFFVMVMLTYWLGMIWWIVTG